ncbi:MAG: ParB/RepB/Spo0J family partition protein [Paracoccaceae bacterium]
MAGKDKFRLVADLAPLESDKLAPDPEPRRRRSPMAEAVAETAESLDERQSERTRLMEKMKADVAAFNQARADDRIDLMVDVTEIRTTALERDRFDLDQDLNDDEMQELKASLAKRGLQQSIKLFQDENGHYQLESGWRRLTAYRQLLAETGDERFRHIRAKVAPALEDIDAAYGRMVDENMVRKGVSHGELAILAVRYARAKGTGADSVEAAVDRLFASAARAKRYHLRQIADLMDRVQDVLGDPSAIPRDTALKVADRVREDVTELARLREMLAHSGRGADAVAGVFHAFLAAPVGKGARPGPDLSGRKIEFRAGGFKCTVKGREIRLLSPGDLNDLDEGVLQRALDAFRAELEGD